VVGDFDGDGKMDYGCYYAPSGNWYLMQSRDGFETATFGYGGTVPVVGDFDGDGKTDYGCYYAPGGNWYLMQSRDGFNTATFGFGGTVPLGR
jgi:myo-inositol-hexaphosphate 3-phosphohydrolase